MTELSFLIDLLLNHKLPKSVKDLIAMRLRDVESRLISNVPAIIPNQVMGPMHRDIVETTMKVPQAASTLALMARHGDLIPGTVVPGAIHVTAPETVTQIAQNPTTAAALQSRAEAMAGGKTDVSTGRPRKW